MAVAPKSTMSLSPSMASYVTKKQDKILTEDEVQSVVAEIESNRFTKSWRTNQAHKAYLKDKHNPSDISNKPIKINLKPESVIKPKPAIREIIRSREVLGWSGQTEIEPVVIDEILILPFNIQPSNDDKVFITPFEVVNSKSESANTASKAAMIKQIPDISEQVPACPRCNSKMVQRVAKNGARQGQMFYGCVQFPKCRGVMNG